MKPDSHEALHNLGLIHHRKRNLKKSLDYINRSINKNPDSPVYIFNSGVLLRDLGRPEEAKQAFIRTVELDPEYAKAYVDLGILESKSGNFDKAFALFNTAFEKDPELPEAHLNLAGLYLKIQQPDKAIECMETLLIHDPGNEEAKYWIASLKGEDIETMPKRIVAQGFDKYSGLFDSHLQGGLRYRAPEMMRGAVGKYLDDKKGQLRILDLGCGTGLCGPLFRDLAETMIGVDLSAGMLAKAREKNAYDSLLEGDLLGALRNEKESLDLAISGDVFVYVGDIRDVFAACFQALRNGGLFSFTTESFQGEGFIDRASGRFAHSAKYIEGLADEFGFTVLTEEPLIIRMENGKPLAGHLYVLSKGERAQTTEDQASSAQFEDISTLYEEAILHHQAGHIERAEEYYRRILDIEPGHADALHYTGVIAFQRNQLADALTLILQAIERNPSAPNFHTNLGLVLRTQGNFEGAASAFKKSLELDPAGIEAMSNLAGVLTIQGNLDESAEYLRNVLTIRPNFAQAHSNLAGILATQGDVAEAENHYLKAIGSDPDFVDPYRNYIDLLVKQQRVDEAANYCRKLLRLWPEDEKTKEILGACLGGSD